MKKRFYKMAALGMACVMTLAGAMTSFAGEWKSDSIGWWWVDDNGSYPAGCWKLIDGNGDGVSEYYCFDEHGYLYQNTTTPDGYVVNADGAWVKDGKVYMETAGNTSQSTATADPGWIQDAKGWRYQKKDGSFVADNLLLSDKDGDGVYYIYSFNSDGYLYQKVGNNDWALYGLCDEEGRLIQRYYHGDMQTLGPYEVVRSGRAWKCVSGNMMPGNERLDKFTGDYEWDAFTSVNLIDLEVSKRDNVRGYDHPE